MQICLCHCYFVSFLSAYTVHNFSADIFTFTSDSLLHHPENTPHTGFHIPSQTAGAIQVVSRATCSVLQFHLKAISYADGSLHGNYPGMRILRLLLPAASVDDKAYIPWLIRRHHGTEDNPFTGICPEYGSCRVAREKLRYHFAPGGSMIIVPNSPWYLWFRISPKD